MFVHLWLVFERSRTDMSEKNRTTELNHADNDRIKREIEDWISKRGELLPVEGDIYQRWYVGVTNKPSRRKKEHIKQKELTGLVYLNTWETASKEDALHIERFFHKKGMLDGIQAGGARSNSVHVYVFKKGLNLGDSIFHILGLV